MYKFLFLFIVVLCSFGSIACINEYEHAHEHEHYYGGFDDADIIPNVEQIRSDIHRRISDTTYFYENFKMGYDDSLIQLSDYASLLVYAGHLERAKVLFQRIEKLWPDQYTTASNLGTVYELLGQPDSALIWITKGYQLNPGSHEESEWVHIKILKYKVAGDSITKGMFGMDYDYSERPPLASDLTLYQFSNALLHQLRERLYFIDPPNEILAQMYFDLGQSLALQYHFNNADSLFQIARTFGFNTDQVAIAIANIEKLQLKEKDENVAIALQKQRSIQRAKDHMVALLLYGSFALIIIIILVIVIFYLVKSKKGKRGELIEVERSR